MRKETYFGLINGLQLGVGGLGMHVHDALYLQDHLPK
jgi:hypothetical protein